MIKIILNGSLVILLSACSGNGLINASHNEISVISEPVGASVYVMGELQGTTPMVVNITKLYPVTYSKEQASLYGHVVLKHEGCSDQIIKITNKMTGKVLKEKLACAGSESAVVQESSVKETSLVYQSARQRLQELKVLKDDGLINNEEYQEIRSRILESL